MNNKAELGEQMFLIYFIFLLIIITVGIVAGSYSAFGKPYDSRKVDSALLLNHVEQCLENTPQLSEVRIRAVLANCGIDKQMLEKGFTLALYVEGKEVFRNGDTVVCGLEYKYPNGPRCSYETINLDIDNSLKEVSIIAGSNIK